MNIGKKKFIILKNSGKVKYSDTLDSIEVNEDDWILVNTGTKFTGDIFGITTINDIRCGAPVNSCNITFAIENYDVPWDETSERTIRIEIANIHQKFSLLQHVLSIHNLDYLLEQNASITSIQELTIENERGRESIDVGHRGNFEQTQRFYGLTNYVELLVNKGVNYLCIEDDKWWFSSKLPESVDYVGSLLDTCGTIYMLKDRIISRFMMIESIVVEVITGELFDSDDSIGREVIGLMFISNDIKSLLETCMLFHLISDMTIASSEYMTGIKITLDLGSRKIITSISNEKVKNEFNLHEYLKFQLNPDKQERIYV